MLGPFNGERDDQQPHVSFGQIHSSTWVYWLEPAAGFDMILLARKNLIS